MSPTSKRLIDAYDRLSAEVEQLAFSAPVTHVYNPLEYARSGFVDYVARYANAPKSAVFLGMNPGPWGMAQTGVPFGEVAHVRRWLGIDTAIGQPRQMHPKRPVLGFDCPRSEVSGRRLWGFFRERDGTPQAFFKDNFVLNYCPLLFCEINADKCRNVTLNQLRAGERKKLESHCDDTLSEAIDTLAPKYLIGVGGYAHQCLLRLFGENNRFIIGKVTHPSPANPKSNRGDYSAIIAAQLEELGIR